MFRFLFSFVLGAAIGFVGWIAGSVYPAPAAVLEKVHAQAIADRVAGDLGAVDWKALRGALSETQFARLRDNVMSESAAAGRVIVVDDNAAGEDSGEAAYYQASYAPPSRVTPAAPAPSTTTPSAAPPPAAAAPAPAPVSTSTSVARTMFETNLALCPRMTVSNSPPFDAARNVRPYSPVVRVNGVSLAVNPTHGACLSSGFGPRSGHPHKGVDFHSDVGGPIYAAADGVVLEMKYRDDYGNMLLIDHGKGVYTRYAHLSAFQKGLAAGAKVKAGDQIGLMGNTAGYPLPIHLHYELLLGDYANPKASFGLEAKSPFDYKA